MKTIKQFFIGAIALLFATTSCIEDFTIRGNGIPISEGRITNGFSEVKSEGAFNVHITNGDDFEIIVNAESNILPYIETDVSNHKLRIYIRGIHSVHNRLPMEVFITTPYLEGILQSGSGIITTDYFTTGHFDAVVSGSGSIETAVDATTIDALISGSGNLIISGEANDADLAISGSGKIDGYDLSILDCDAKISGSGNLWVKVERFLIATISGSGNVYYYGTPDIETHISGSGDVIQHQ